MQAPPPSYNDKPNQQQPAPGAYGMPMGGGLPVFGDLPVGMTCPHCHQQGMTRIEKKNGLVTWLACLGICFVGGGLGCCFIPFCIKGLKDTQHHCPSCSALVGEHKML